MLSNGYWQNILIHKRSPQTNTLFVWNKSGKEIDLKHFSDTRVFIEYSKDMKDAYQKITKLLKLFCDMIANMLIDRNTLRSSYWIIYLWQKIKHFLVFTTQSYIFFPKNVGLRSITYFIIKNPNKRDLQQTAFNKSYDIGFTNFRTH